MLQRTVVGLFKFPKNMGVAPEYNIWHKKYEPWEHLRGMARLAGTGFYIPPEWYQHFRMFPPQQHTFMQEDTLNPRTESLTQERTAQDGQRAAVRDELGRRSRTLAAEGMRYYNVFWVQRPLDEMERRYYQLKGNGAPHEDAIKGAVELFHRRLTSKKRLAAMQSEEARLSGGFITMREASAVLGALVHMERARFTPHNAAELAASKREQSMSAPVLEGRARWVRKEAPLAEEPAKDKDSAQASAAKDASTQGAVKDGGAAAASESPESATAEDLFTFLEDSTGYMTIDVAASPHESLASLSEEATGRTGQADWYKGSHEVRAIPPHQP